ncbi:vitamin-D-receptor interacting mediator subunit 4-domain-containing protein [Pyronema domesticum]|nr:vitamin-D-receptor interacting mediator subunit 4-domain-containing protein [Pyronema domesticum]
MYTTVQKALDNLDEHLAKVIESVSSYNPSRATVAALVQADDELQATLAELEEHQQNYHRTIELQQTSDALDDKLTDLLTILAETRQHLIDTPSTKFPTPPKEVEYNQLLQFARNISKYSKPPNPLSFEKWAREQVLPPPPPPQSEGEAKPEEPVKTKLPLGINEEDLLHMDNSGALPYAPWPHEFMMKTGALAALGKDGIPVDMIPKEDKPQEEDKGDQARKDSTSNGGMDDAEKARRSSYQQQQHAAPKPAAPKNFSLDLWPGDDDDE